MRIFYGIQGTGNGHLARARALVPALKNENIELDCLFSGRSRDEFFDMDMFGDFRCLQGFTLVVQNSRLNFLATLRHNNLWKFCRDVFSLQIKQYDLVISDFEPVTAWAARLRGIPCMGVSHQNAFHYAVPKVKGYAASRFLMQYFAPVDIALGFHWHHFNQPVLPPLIEAHGCKQAIPGKILVYMGFEALEDILHFLQPFSEFEFFVFARVPQMQRHRHISVHPISHAEFHRHLEDCAGVISNAGFELASECLALGKKLLVKPIHGQFEQLSNALALQALKRATVMESLDQGVLAQWLQLPQHVPIQYPDVGKAIARWLVEGNKKGEVEGRKESIADLAASLWQDFNPAYQYDEKFGNTIVPDLVV